MSLNPNDKVLHLWKQIQGVHRPWKSWKVSEFEKKFQAWKSLKIGVGLESPGINLLVAGLIIQKMVIKMYRCSVCLKSFKVDNIGESCKVSWT
jgi:hypothetical protein